MDGLHIKAPESFARERSETLLQLRRHWHVRPETTNCIAHLSTGHLKSLLQKLIRFSPRSVYFPFEGKEITVSATEMLAECCIALSAKPLSFVPDLPTSLNGIHSFTKRLVITMFEDAWPLYGLVTEAVGFSCVVHHKFI